MIEHFQERSGIAQAVPAQPEQPDFTQPSAESIDGWRRKVAGLFAAGIAVATFLVAPNIEATPAHAATTKYVEIKAPGNGKWASTASGQANQHKIHGDGQLAVDEFLSAGSDVILDASAPNGGVVSFDLVSTWNSCGGDAGKGIKLAVKVDSEKVGEVAYAHLDGMVTQGPFTNGMSLGKTKKWDFKKDCWDVTTDAGVHTHFEARSDSGNYACYYDRPVGSPIASGIPVARLGKTAATAIQQACTETPSSTTSYANIPEGREFHSEGYVYTKVGGSAWPIEPKSSWTDVDKAQWGGGELLGPVPVAEVHDHEAGFGAGTANPPKDGTTVYELGGNGQQYYFIKGRAYPIQAGELGELGVINQALPVPWGNSRLPGFTGQQFVLDNGEAYKVTGDPAVRQVIYIGSNAAGYHVNNDTVKNCLRLTQGRVPLIIPQSARTSMLLTDVSEPAGCTFPPGMVLRGPGGMEQWRIEGNNPYVRRYFPNALLTYLHTSGNPNVQELSSTASINNLPQGATMSVPEGMAFVDMGNGAEFLRQNNEWHYVSSPDMNTCLGIEPWEIVQVPSTAVGALPQGEWAGCAYENRILARPDGRAYWVENGRKHYLPNPAVRDCLMQNRGTGSPASVSNPTVDTYVDSADGYCEFERDYGVKFVREQGSPAVYFVEDNGVLRHAGSLCVSDSDTTRWKQFRVWVVSAGMTARPQSQFGPAWSASPAACDALPKVWLG